VDHTEVAPLISWSIPAKKSNRHTYTPARQRALARRSSIFGILVVLIVVLALAQFGEDGLATLLKLRSQEKDLAADVELLEKENAVLENQLKGLASDPLVLETLAREEQNMQGPDEEVLTVLPEDPNH
jgi:cell division protein FtsB